MKRGTMTKKIIWLVVSCFIVAALLLASCAREPLPVRQVAGQSYDWYENEEYGFRIKHPYNWRGQAVSGAILFYCKSVLGIPSISVSVMSANLSYREKIVKGLEAIGGTDIEIVSEGKGKLVDGTETCEVVVKWNFYDYPIKSFDMGVKVDDRWLSVSASTVEAKVSYDEEWCREITYSLEFE